MITARPARVARPAPDLHDPAARTGARPIPVPDPGGRPIVDVVIPVHDEEADLARSVRAVHAHVNRAFPFSARITIADNASGDATWDIARELARTLPGVRAVRLERKGRGRALRHAWRRSDAPVLAYMDVDLSTDLAGLLPLVAPLVSGHSDLAIGSRRAAGARVERGARRELISRVYNLLLHATLRLHASDAQCGFKAIRADVAERILALVEDDAFFFDTELLVVAERAGLRIHEVPVDWVDDPDSRVDVLATALADLRGMARMARAIASGGLGRRLRDTTGAPGRRGLRRQLPRFAVIGAASTLAYVLAYLLLRGGLGPQPANALALLLTAIANTVANRRITFGVRGRRRLARHLLEGLVVFLLGLGVTSGSLALLHAAARAPGRALEVTVLVCANAAATVLRFLLLRGWVFHPARVDPVPPSTRSAS